MKHHLKIELGLYISFYRIISSVENWTLNNSERRRIETAEMRFLRRVSGCTFTNHVCNTTVLSALQMYVLKERIQDYRNSWNNHILGMTFSSLT
jgi:hypothetical protein